MGDNRNPSPFERAVPTDKRLKLFLWGDSGSGKTTLALGFPSPVVIDMESGTDWYADRGFDRIKTADAGAVMDAVDWLIANPHDYRTLVVDPISVYWEALQTKWSDIFLNRNKGGKGFKFEFYDTQPRDWNTIKAEYKELIRKITLLDMNVVVTARSKTLLSDDGQFKKLGETYDAEKSTAYAFDVVLRLHRRGGMYYASNLEEGPYKCRIPGFPKGEFEQDYSVFEAALGDSLTRPAVAQPRATPNLIAEIRSRAAILDLTDAQIRAGCEKRGFQSIDELTESAANEIIAALDTAIQKEAKSAKS